MQSFDDSRSKASLVLLTKTSDPDEIWLGQNPCMAHKHGVRRLRLHSAFGDASCGLMHGMSGFE
jgi:hypothetical protein